MERNPIRQQREKRVREIQIGQDILKNARNELYLSFRYLDVALSSFQFVPDEAIRGIGTDGIRLFFHPDELIGQFQRGRTGINRWYLHSVLHCLFGHLWHQKEREKELWQLSCDITVEWILDGLQERAVHCPVSGFRRDVYRNIQKEFLKLFSAPDTALTAERVFWYLQQIQAQPDFLKRLETEFAADDHREWQKGREHKGSPSPQQKKWDEIRERMETEVQLFSKEASEGGKRLTDQVISENRSRYDYKNFLRKFSVLKEEMQADQDTFDYIFYCYGMELYGNMPLIEPQETREVKKVEDFVIVLDTSMSCKGDLIRQFLRETFAVLSESESFFRKINLRILQCDDAVEEDVCLTCGKETEDYLKKFEVRGMGGTDFRPAFVYVEELIRKQSFHHLRGMVYFTDGYGTFPLRKPDYDVAFVFMRQDYRDVDVPPWAMKLILDPLEYSQGQEKMAEKKDVLSEREQK